MIRQAYFHAIQLLTSLRTMPATLENIQRVCPHLKPEEIKQLIKKTRASKRKSYYLALPPLVVSGAALRLEISVRNRATTISYAYAGRTPASYAPGNAERESCHNVPYTKRAVEFARKNWGDSLVLDSWRDIVTVHLQNPKKLSTSGYPTGVMNLHFVLDRKWNDIINDHSAPTSVLINRSIVMVTRFQSEKDELSGGRGGYTDFNCSRCGGGLCLTACSSCRAKYRDDQWRCGWNTPLPQKLIDYALAHGHKFALDPALAQETERTAWADWQAKEQLEQLRKTQAELERLLAETEKQVKAASHASIAAVVNNYQATSKLGLVLKIEEEKELQARSAAALAETEKRTARNQKRKAKAQERKEQEAIGAREAAFKQLVRDRFGKIRGVVGIRVYENAIAVRVANDAAAKRLPRQFKHRKVTAQVVGKISKRVVK